MTKAQKAVDVIIESLMQSDWALDHGRKAAAALKEYRDDMALDIERIMQDELA